MKVTITKALNSYFNAKEATNHIGPSDFLKELKALSEAEKLDLAQGVCAVTGDTLIMPAVAPVAA